jgi:hypothetical protein
MQVAFVSHQWHFDVDDGYVGVFVCPVLHSMWVVWMQLPLLIGNWTSHRLHM